jgi:hypothetical protein
MLDPYGSHAVPEATSHRWLYEIPLGERVGLASWKSTASTGRRDIFGLHVGIIFEDEEEEDRKGYAKLLLE